MLNNGENEVSALYYAPLPKELVAKEHVTVDNLH